MKKSEFKSWCGQCLESNFTIDYILIILKLATSRSTWKCQSIQAKWLNRNYSSTTLPCMTPTRTTNWMAANWSNLSSTGTVCVCAQNLFNFSIYRCSILCLSLCFAYFFEMQTIICCVYSFCCSSFHYIRWTKIINVKKKKLFEIQTMQNVCSL